MLIFCACYRQLGTSILFSHYSTFSISLNVSRQGGEICRYPLLTAIATRYQFTNVAMPPIIEISGTSLAHACRVRGIASGLLTQCCAQVPLTHCHCNRVTINWRSDASDYRNFQKHSDAHLPKVCGFASALRTQCCAQVHLTHCHCNTLTI